MNKNLNPTKQIVITPADFDRLHGVLNHPSYQPRRRHSRWHRSIHGPMAKPLSPPRCLNASLRGPRKGA